MGTVAPSIKEEHLCQVAEGSQIGKITQDDDVCLTPNAWFVIGAQIEALLERFGATDCGRLRAFCAVLNRGQCLKTDFVGKFLRRSSSFKHLASILKSVARSQQREEPSLSEHDYSPEAFTVHAALHDGANDALEETQVSSSVTATVVKFIGKGFGSLAVSNASARSGEWATVCTRGFLAKLDPRIRFFNTLAAGETVKKHIITQLCVEMRIAAFKALAKPAFPQSADSIVEELGMAYTDVVNACRCFLDYIASKASLVTYADANGLLMVLPVLKHLLRSGRESAFTRGSAQDVVRYGGQAVYFKFRLAPHWRDLLAEMILMRIAKTEADDGNVVWLCKFADMEPDVQTLVRSWKLLPATMTWLGIVA